MPTYDFKCDDCKTTFEVFTSISAKEKGLKLTCEQCGGQHIHQAVTGFLFHTPGSYKENTNHSHSSSSKCSNCHSGSCSSCH